MVITKSCRVRCDRDPAYDEIRLIMGEINDIMCSTTVRYGELERWVQKYLSRDMGIKGEDTVTNDEDESEVWSTDENSDHQDMGESK